VDVVLRIADQHGFRGRDSEPPARLQQGRGIRLLCRRTVACDQRIEQWQQRMMRKQRLGETQHLVRHASCLHPALAHLAQAFDDARIH
jgi:hypothetical protein